MKIDVIKASGDGNYAAEGGEVVKDVFRIDGDVSTNEHDRDSGRVCGSKGDGERDRGLIGLDEVKMLREFGFIEGVDW